MFGKRTSLLIAAVVIAGIITSFGIGSNLVEPETRMTEDNFKILARNAALAGQNRMEQVLFDEVISTGGTFTLTTIRGNYDNIEYTASIADVDPPSATEVRVISTGTATTGRGKDVDFNVQSEYEIVFDGAPGGGEVPEALQEAVTSQCDINLGGSLRIDSPDGSNASVRTNGALSAAGDGWTVHGYGYMSDDMVSLPHNDRRYLETNLNPYDALGAGVLVEVDPLADEVFDAVMQVRADYYDNADICVGCEEDDYDGVTVVASLGAIDFDALNPSRQNPLVVIINGDMHVSGGTFPAYTIFLVTGDVHITGGYYASDGDPEDEFLSTLAFYIDGDVHLNGNAEIWGQFFTVGDFDLGNGTPVINGNITALCEDGDGNLLTGASTEMRGNFTINYYGANPFLSGGETQVTLERRTHSEW